MVIPAEGGDTIWANTAAAYDDLPEPLQRLAGSLRAIHSSSHDYSAARARPRAEDSRYHAEAFASTADETEHPLVRVHPETGDLNMLLGGFVQRIAGLNRGEPQRKYELFQSYATAPENTLRLRWRQGDVVIWDNRATQHVAVNDYRDIHRVVRRVTIAGDVSVVVDDRRSTPAVRQAPDQTQTRRTPVPPKIRLGAFLPGGGQLIAASRHPDSPVDGASSFAFHVEPAQEAERGLFDAYFLADSLAIAFGTGAEGGNFKIAGVEPVTLCSALAPLTRNLGFIANASTTYEKPYNTPANSPRWI